MKSIKKYMVIALCAVIVACSVARPMTVKASSVNASRIVDVALTKTGIVANQSILKAVEDKLVLVVRDTLKLYDAWLDENPDKEISADTFNEFVDGGGLSTFSYRAIEPYLNRKFIKALMSEYRDSLDEAPVDIGEVITGEKSLLGVIISLPSELVNFIRSLFDEEVEELTDFYYIDTYSPQDVNPLWFNTSDKYQDFCYALNNYEGYMYFTGRQNYNTLLTFGDSQELIQWKIYAYSNESFFVKDSPSQYQNWKVSVYDSNWNLGVVCKTQEADYFTADTIANFSFDNLTKEVTGSSSSDSFEKIPSSGLGNGGIWTNDGRPIKVFKTVNALKSHALGNSPYYVTNNANKYETTDNSVSIGGDYLESTNYSYSHDVVQNNINNSETITNETINNVVNNNVTNITNNYASTVNPDNGDNGVGGDGLGSILDGLGSIISAVTEIVGFLLGVIGDVIGLIGDLFKTIFNGLKAFASIFTGFTDLLAEVFGFIPQQLIDFLVLAVEASVGIAIWRKFSKN